MPFDIATGAEFAYVEAEIRKRAGKLNGTPPIPVESVTDLGSKSVSDLMALSLPQSRTLIEGLIPVPGVSVLIGAKKAGKTILGVQIGMSVAANTPFCDYYRITQSGPVLFIEQDDPAGASSLKEIVGRTAISKQDVPFRWLVPTDLVLGPAFLAALEVEIIEHGLRLVIIDSYTAIRGTRRGGGDVVKAEAQDFRELDALAKRTDSAIVILHHISHGNAAKHWSDRAAGSYAIGQSTEAQIYIDRYPDLDINAPERLVRVEGRHIPTSARVLRFREATLDYEHVYEGTAAVNWSEILEIRQYFGGRAFSPKDLCHETGVARITAHRLISRLAATGALRRCGYGEYVLAEEVR